MPPSPVRRPRPQHSGQHPPSRGHSDKAACPPHSLQAHSDSSITKCSDEEALDAPPAQGKAPAATAQSTAGAVTEDWQWRHQEAAQQKTRWKGTSDYAPSNTCILVMCINCVHLCLLMRINSPEPCAGCTFGVLVLHLTLSRHRTMTHQHPILFLLHSSRSARLPRL